MDVRNPYKVNGGGNKTGNETIVAYLVTWGDPVLQDGLDAYPPHYASPAAMSNMVALSAGLSTPIDSWNNVAAAAAAGTRAVAAAAGTQAAAAAAAARRYYTDATAAGTHPPPEYTGMDNAAAIAAGVLAMERRAAAAAARRYYTDATAAGTHAPPEDTGNAAAIADLEDVRRRVRSINLPYMRRGRPAIWDAAAAETRAADAAAAGTRHRRRNATAAGTETDNSEAEEAQVPYIHTKDIQFAFKGDDDEIKVMKTVPMSESVKAELNKVRPPEQDIAPYKNENTNGNDMMLQLDCELKGDQCIGLTGFFPVNVLAPDALAKGAAIVMTPSQLAALSGNWLTKNHTNDWSWCHNRQFQPHGVLSQSVAAMQADKLLTWNKERSRSKKIHFESRSVTCDGQEMSVVNPHTLSSARFHVPANEGEELDNDLRITAAGILRIVPIVSPNSFVVYNGDDECPVCHDVKDTMVISSCRHPVCVDCVSKLRVPKICPMCRIPWTTLPTYRPPVPKPQFVYTNYNLNMNVFTTKIDNFSTIKLVEMFKKLRVETQRIRFLRGTFDGQRMDVAAKILTDYEIDEFKSIIKHVCGVNQYLEMRLELRRDFAVMSISHHWCTNGGSKYMFVPFPRSPSAPWPNELTVTYCDVIDIDAPIGKEDFKPMRLELYAQVASALRNKAHVTPYTILYGPLQMLLKLVPTESMFPGNQCDNCNRHMTSSNYGEHYIWQDDNATINLCVDCYKALRYVEPEFRWDGLCRRPNGFTNEVLEDFDEDFVEADPITGVPRLKSRDRTVDQLVLEKFYDSPAGDALQRARLLTSAVGVAGFDGAERRRFNHYESDGGSDIDSDEIDDIDIDFEAPLPVGRASLR